MADEDPYVNMQRGLARLLRALFTALRHAPKVEEDARGIVAANLIAECEAAWTVGKLIEPLLANPFHESSLKFVVATSADRVLPTIKTVVMNTKSGMLVNWLFQIEHFANLVSDALGHPVTKSGGFDHRKLLKRLGIVDADIRADCLAALQSIRNGLHNNGVHVKPSKSFKINGMDYDFVQDEPIGCASWDDMLPLMVLSVDTFTQYLKAPEVRAIPLIEDPFSTKYGLERAKVLSDLSEELMRDAEEE